MKRKLLLTLMGISACATAALLTACANKTRAGEPDFYAYEFSDVVMTQTGINSYDFEFTADCESGDAVNIYLTERDRIKPTDSPIAVVRTDNAGGARFAFSATLNLNEEYYLWVDGENKQAMLPLTIPSMFPSMAENGEGGAIFNFNYTYGVSWSSFCDPEGKAVYSSDKSTFDESAELIEGNVLITTGECAVPSAKYDSSKYYFSVTTAKNGLLKIISSPVVAVDAVKSQFSSMTANVGAGPELKVTVGTVEGSEIAREEARYLQLVVKTGTGDEIYVADAEFESGTATMAFDCSDLLKEGVWYDVCLAWRGALITDVPKRFGGNDVMGVSSVKTDDGLVYRLIDWKDTGMSDDAAMLKVYFEKDMTRYAEEFCDGYLVTMDVADGATLSVKVTLKDNVHVPPRLVITGGSAAPLGTADGTASGDGGYSYSLALADVLEQAGTWYDIRLAFGNVLTELTKDECISNLDFNKAYASDGRTYRFAEWNGFLKIYFEE